MSLPDIFRGLFRDEAAERELGLIGRQVTLPTFNLATTSLRHIRKWYDRLEAIASGQHDDHPNYYSDPESLGLVRRNGRGMGVLTRAGRLFLDTKGTCQDEPARAEYELIRILYFSGINHSADADRFLTEKRQHLLVFLDACITTPAARMILREPKLLAIAEGLPRFPGSLQRFLRLRADDLNALGELGERGFSSLWREEASPAGLGRLAKKIGGDYTRAEIRRSHFLMAMLLHEIRTTLMRRGRLFDQLHIPAPFSNLITEEDVLELCHNYTDELRVMREEGKVMVFLRPDILPTPTAPRVRVIGIRTTRGRPRRTRRATGRVRTGSTGRRVTEAPLAKEAEDYIERMILRPKYRSKLVRVGHTDRESIPLADLELPGADFYVRRNGRQSRGAKYFEVKSAIGRPPASIRITRAEYRRAKKCHSDGLPYEVYVVVFLTPEQTPSVLRIRDFAAKASHLSLDDLSSIEIPIDVS